MKPQTIIAKVHQKPAARKRICAMVCAAVLLLLMAGCGPTDDELKAVTYTPWEQEDWQTATPEDVGLDPDLIARLYYSAQSVETITSLLVIKDGKLIAEKYFTGGSLQKKNLLQSVTKSITGTLAGIAVDKGLLRVDQKMMEFFPELVSRISDHRKDDITVEMLLQMRAGYTWEEADEALFNMLYSRFLPSYLVTFPLAYNPGEDMWYSNLSSHLAGVIVARAAGQDLMTFAKENLFEPLGISPGSWITDLAGNYNGHGDLRLTSRDMAKIGQLYLNQGMFNGERVVSAAWIQDALAMYSENAWKIGIGSNVSKMGYGYQWWSAEADGYRYNFAWGHGGQEIALVPDLNMVIVVTADPQIGNHGDESWKHERQNLNLVGDFIATLPVN